MREVLGRRSVTTNCADGALVNPRVHHRRRRHVTFPEGAAPFAYMRGLESNFNSPRMAPLQKGPVETCPCKTQDLDVAFDYLAKSLVMSPNAFNSSAFPDGSTKNIVACSPGCPLKRM